MDNVELEKLLLETPATIRGYEVDIISLREEQGKNIQKSNDIEAIIKSEVGLNLQFTNEAQRKAAIGLKLKAHVEYQALEQSLPKKAIEIEHAQTVLKYQENMFRAYLAIAGMGARP